jgi:cytochrome c oxidase assembly factor 2
MPPHMHPRSRMTASLFTTTLMVSFLVVAAPHLIPCPVDPRTLADSADPTREGRRRRRRPIADDAPDALAEERARRQHLEDRLAPRRECPIPKPGGLVGTVLGLKHDSDDSDDDAPLSVTQHVERARGKMQPRDDQ